jgi:hypothetical protein
MRLASFQYAEVTKRDNASPLGTRLYADFAKPSSSTSFVLRAAIASLLDGVVLRSWRNRITVRGTAAS